MTSPPGPAPAGGHPTGGRHRRQTTAPPIAGAAFLMATWAATWWPTRAAGVVAAVAALIYSPFSLARDHVVPEGRMFCTQCGTRNPEGARFCANCGAALLTADDAPTTTISLPPQEVVDTDVDGDLPAPVEELREGTAMLVVRRGPNAGSRFLLNKDVVTAGRHPESDIFLDDITVSRRHAEIRRTLGGFTVHDVGSLNGTYVNRGRVEDHELANGDELQVGKFKLVFFAGTRPAGG